MSCWIVIAENDDTVVRRWILGVAAGDQEAADQLWKHYYPRVRSAVGKRIAQMPQLAGESSDLASEAMHTFFRKIGGGEFPELAKVNSLWGLLRTIALRKINDSFKGATAVKRGGRFRRLDVDPNFAEWDQSQVDVDLEDLVNHLMEMLSDDTDRMIVKLRWQGLPPADVAELMEISVRTVQRRIGAIEEIWKRRPCS